MKPVFLIATALAIMTMSACAHVEPVETIAFNPPLEMTTALSGGVPIVDGSIYAGLSTMPEVVLKNAATAEMSTAKIEPFVALAGSQQTSKYLQTVSVINLDTTGSVCLYLETWAQTCSSAVSFTCLGASLQGTVTPAGATRTYRFTGENKICAAASEANVDAQLERSVSYAR